MSPIPGVTALQAASLEIASHRGVVLTEEYGATSDRARKMELWRRSNRRKVPEISVDDHLLDGCSKLFERDESDKLNRILILSASALE